MAESAISILLDRLAPTVEEKIRREFSLLLNPNGEAQNLSSKLKKIQEVLMDAEQQGVIDPKVRSWLAKLQDISYDIDEVLDQWDLQNLRQESSSHQWRNKVSSFLPSGFYSSKGRSGIARKMQKLNKRLDLISKENENEFKFIPNLSREYQDFRRIISTSMVDVSEVHGRDGDLKLLKKKLLPGSGSVGEDDIRIVSLVGMGGMGKTTLAQLAFNDNTINDYFEVKKWVCVSHPFDEIKIANAILEDSTGNSLTLSQPETLLQGIKDSISEKRFLLVLDDVWTEDDTMWKPLKITLIKNGAPGSRILLTTRNERVAKKLGSTEIQLLDPLSDSCCWSILSQIAFHERNEGDREMLKEIGWKMSLKCKGMPLAAKTLGSLLRFKSSLQEWENVLKSKVWEMDEARTNIFPFLELSYNELHPVVKRCFSYCAIFPKDFRINVDDLIRVWMAQGFLHSRGTFGEMELKGREYFEDLAMRSFFQDFERGGVEGNRLQWCRMHDIVHDFAQLLTNNECLLVENIDEVQSRGVWAKSARHLNLLNFEAKTTLDLSSHCQTEKLCSFVCTGNGIPLNLLNRLKRVKLLNLNDCDLENVPKELGSLVHIRYLNLSRNSLLEKLPESMCNLYNLQTLNLTECSYLSGLPQGIYKLVNLRHLLVFGTSGHFKFTQGLNKLVNLQTLDEFICNRESENKLGYLKDLNLVGGSLKISIIELDEVDDHEVEAGKADLKSKTFIQHLTLHFSARIGLRVMNALEPSPNLLRLDFEGSYLPNWMATLTNLRILKIHGGRNENGVLHSLRNLPFLEELTLYDLQVKRLSLEFFGLSKAASTKQMDTLPPSAFPKLMCLSISFCWGLTEWDDIGEEVEDDAIISVLPCLHRLYICSCPVLKALPHRLLRKAALSLQELQIAHCGCLEEMYGEGKGKEWDKLAHIPHVYM